MHVWDGECHVHAGIRPVATSRACAPRTRAPTSSSTPSAAARPRSWSTSPPATSTPRACTCSRPAACSATPRRPQPGGDGDHRDRDRDAAPAARWRRPTSTSSPPTRRASCRYMKMITLPKLRDAPARRDAARCSVPDGRSPSARACRSSGWSRSPSRAWPAVNTFAGGGLDRMGPRRTDAAWLAERRADPASRVVVATSDGVLVDPDGTPATVAVAEVPADAETVLLGVGPDGRRGVRGRPRSRARRRAAAGGVARRAPRRRRDVGARRRETSSPTRPGCSTGTAATASARTAARRRTRVEAGLRARDARTAARSTTRAPTRWSSCSSIDGDRVLLGRSANWPERPLLRARRVRRAGGEPRAGRRARGRRGGGRHGRRRPLRLLAAVAVPGLAHARLRGDAARAASPHAARPRAPGRSRWFTREDLRRAAAGDGEVSIPPPLGDRAAAHGRLAPGRGLTGGVSRRRRPARCGPRRSCRWAPRVPSSSAAACSSRARCRRPRRRGRRRRARPARPAWRPGCPRRRRLAAAPPPCLLEPVRFVRPACLVAAGLARLAWSSPEPPAARVPEVAAPSLPPPPPRRRRRRRRVPAAAPAARRRLVAAAAVAAGTARAPGGPGARSAGVLAARAGRCRCRCAVLAAARSIRSCPRSARAVAAGASGRCGPPSTRSDDLPVPAGRRASRRAAASGAATAGVTWAIVDARADRDAVVGRRARPRRRRPACPRGRTTSRELRAAGDERAGREHGRRARLERHRRRAGAARAGGDLGDARDGGVAGRRRASQVQQRVGRERRDAAAQRGARARRTSWRTAPSLSPSSRATSACGAAVDRDGDERGALALGQRGDAGQRARISSRRSSLGRGLGGRSPPIDSGSSSVAAPTVFRVLSACVVGDPVQPRPQVAHLGAGRAAPTRR